MCREPGLLYAQTATQTHVFNNNNNNTAQPPPIMSGVSCKGNEDSLDECYHDATNFCPGSGLTEVAAVVCVQEQSDLELDIYALMSSVYLEDKHLFFLQVNYLHFRDISLYNFCLHR